MENNKGKLYRLNNFTPEEIKRAKEFITILIKGYYTVKLEQHVDEIFQQISNIDFYGNDGFDLHFSVHMLCNDLLSALGVARNEQRRFEKKV